MVKSSFSNSRNIADRFGSNKSIDIDIIGGRGGWCRRWFVGLYEGRRKLENSGGGGRCSCTSHLA